MVEASFFVLVCFAILVLAASQLHLYRVAGAGAMPAALDTTGGWPLSIRPGDSVPRQLGDIGRWRGVVVICSDERDEYFAAATVLAVAREWDVEVRLALLDSGRGSGWEKRLSTRLDVARVHPAAVRELGLLETPVALAMADGKLLDATADLGAPSLLAGRFKFVASALRPATSHGTTSEEMHHERVEVACVD